GQPQAITGPEDGTPGADGIVPFTSRAALVAAVGSGSLDSLPNGSVLYFNQGGFVKAVYKSTGATTLPGLPGWLPAGAPSTIHWGAGLGTTSATNDTAAVQAMFNYLTPLGSVPRMEGRIHLHSSVTINGIPRMLGETWAHHIICVDGNYPAFIVNASGTMNGMDIRGIRASCQVASANTANAFLRFSGPATSLMQRGRIEGNNINNFYSGFVYDMLPRTTDHGLEGGVNWVDFSDNHYSNVMHAHYVLRGSGTGNTYMDDKPAIRPTGKYYRHEPTVPNTVMGDLIFSGIHGNGVGGDCAFISVAAGTVYGAQISINGNQLDANMVAPVELPTDFTFRDINALGNNWGGNTVLGGAIAPIRYSNITGRGYSKWRLGNDKASTATGAVTIPLFEVEMTGSGVLVDVEVFSEGQLGVGYVSAEYWVTYDAGGSVVVERSKQRSSTAAGALDISFISVSAGVARVRAVFTQASAGTTTIFGNLEARGGAAFKAKRL
ncbi:MAG: hypothetical protein ACPG61_16655, partial [Paracoccaceae bacterium]